MSWGHRVGFVALLLTTAGAGCEDDAALPAGAAGEPSAAGAPEQGGVSTGGAATQGGAGSPSEAGVSTSAGATHAAGAPGAAGAAGACQGDAELWASLTASPKACATDDDCCVVINSCLSEAQVVHADDFDAAQTAWPYCDADCTDCIPPVVRVTCDNGHCVGSVDTTSLDDGVSHCGDTAPAGGSPGQSFTCHDH